MFYTYILRDPRDNKPFYIGKGTGKRILSHELEAKQGRQSAKCQHIRNIWSTGLTSQERV